MICPELTRVHALKRLWDRVLSKRMTAKRAEGQDLMWRGEELRSKIISYLHSDTKCGLKRTSGWPELRSNPSVVPASVWQ